jgi:glycerol-3-phosphate dehydrogenase
LCLENVRAAADAGAVVLNQAEVVALRSVAQRVVGAEVEADGSIISVEAKTVVNAAGPWVDMVRRLEDPDAGTSVRLSKGVHALVPLAEPWRIALTIAQDAVRVTFAVPWYGMLLLGTTDTEFEGDPRTVAAEPLDVEIILREASVALDLASLRSSSSVTASYAGLRVLPAGEGESVNARRETVYSVGSGGMLSVAGGKLTTYRRIALGALERLRGDLGLRKLEMRPFPLPGAAGSADEVVVPIEVEPELRTYLHHLYGRQAADVLALGVERPELLERVHPDGLDIAAQVVHAGQCEWALTADDVMRRRTTLEYRGLAGTSTRARVESLLAPLQD